MKNCIVLSGQFRTFDKTKEKIKHFVEVNNLSVYCHLWSTDQEEIDSIKHHLNPKKLMVEDCRYYKEYFDSIEQSIRSSNPKPSEMDVLSNHASMNFSRKQAFNLIDTDYDNFIYCRYDIEFVDPFKIESLDDFLYTPTEESYNLISDIFCISPMKFAEHYFIFDKFQQLHSSPFEQGFLNYLNNVKNYGENNIKIHQEHRYCPHMILLRNLQNNDVPFNLYNFPLRLCR